MKRWFQRFAVFLLIAGLIVGGLAWATVEALQMESHRRQETADKDVSEKLRKALLRLDGFISPQLARENSRPFAHFTPLHAPIPAMTRQGIACPPGSVRVPSPLMEAELPNWVLLHFQYNADNSPPHRWQSPEVLPPVERDWLKRPPFHLTLVNVTPERQELLMDFSRKYPAEMLLAEARKCAPSAVAGESAVDMKNELALGNSTNASGGRQSSRDNGYNQNVDAQQQLSQVPNYSPDPDKLARNAITNTQRSAPRGGKGIDAELNLDSITSSKASTCEVADVQLSAMKPVWFPSPEKPDYLLCIRLARFGKKEIAQGVILDWPQLRDELTGLTTDLFPGAQLTPLPETSDPEGEFAMSALPVQLNLGTLPELEPAGWTPLRIGLAVAWAATLLALVAMGLSGWSLIDLSERRIRFVSAVTHELRTPLTTLRLYLDMLTTGLVHDEVQKSEYLNTLNSESERLHRLIGNVLDFSRLEKQSARITPQNVALASVVDQIRDAWQSRCDGSEKQLVVENQLPSDLHIQTDPVLVQQIVGNLIDNACKYSKCATDRRVWLRLLPAGANRLAIEVEDCGPGIGRREWRSIFRPFRRGLGADTTAGGVGLGLALARRWAGILGGRLELCKGEHGSGACFRLELPRV